MAEPLKNSIGADTVNALAERLEAVAGFDGAGLRALATEFDGLELKERINLIADTIAADRPYLDILDAVVDMAGDKSLDMWAAWPLCSVIERHGVAHPHQSLQAMETVTKRFSCEFAIRPFLQHHPEPTFDHLNRWVDDPDESVRRLVSEGTRPYLPWGPRVARLIDEPQRAIALLDRLRLDPSETVRRSVANHLNDVARLDADLVIDTLKRWTGDKPEPDRALIRHALRTLVKAGKPEALALLGFTTDPAVGIDRFDCRPSAIELGQSIELNAVIRSTSTTAQQLVVDIVIHHVKANGDTSPKVFKWTAITLEPGASEHLTKTRPIRPISTRIYHPGRHAVDLQIAGRTLASTGFDLTLS
ncbi:MAG: DNA alkylation repair protein [Acidimicrobiia bacterium]|nr:DNA alkylation repair protein [Acidimicrobiia bacterium]